MDACLRRALALNQRDTMKLLLLPLLLLIATPTFAHADGPADNLADKVRPVPPPGIPIPDEVRAELKSGVASLAADIAKLREELKGKPALLEHLPDVEIFDKAVDWALRYDEFFKTNEFKTARTLLQEGHSRAAAMRSGNMPWLAVSGAVVRGYRSRIDGSVQPYGLVIPPGTPNPGSRKPMRLDIWFHGRGETLSELDFIQQRNNPKNLGEFAPSNAVVLHPYGRYCNGSRFAGETDTFEAMADLQRDYPVDENRIVVRGFSLGGASVWHFASHHAGRWAAVAPGAGFSETADFLKVFQREKLSPPWWEQKLWRLHDSPDWVENYRYLPTVAYSGEIDGQKQAADVMAVAFKSAGMDLTHIIGPQTPHRYHPESKKQISELIDSYAATGREVLPKKVSFVTYTTRYNRMHWVQVDGIQQHWEKASVQGELVDHTAQIKTAQVTALTLHLPVDVSINIDGASFPAPPSSGARIQPRSFVSDGKGWRAKPASEEVRGRLTLTKHHGLQGPIDDAFMDSFLVVRPTGTPLNEKIGAWTQGELAHMTNHWRQQYRGNARVVDDSAVTREDIDHNNLILFGDPQSNRLLKQIAAQLPIPWSAEGVKEGSTNFVASTHALVCIAPNPLAPDHYVVLNSGFTFREYDYLNNARQVPKLPDYAIVDVSKPVTSRAPGGIASAGFFDENWKLKAK